MADQDRVLGQVIEQRRRLVEEQRQVVLDAGAGDAGRDVLVDAGFGRITFDRITSYNVCYTKLLRVALQVILAGAHDDVVGAAIIEAGDGRRALVVDHRLAELELVEIQGAVGIVEQLDA